MYETKESSHGVSQALCVGILFSTACQHLSLVALFHLDTGKPCSGYIKAALGELFEFGACKDIRVYSFTED